MNMTLILTTPTTPTTSEIQDVCQQSQDAICFGGQINHPGLKQLVQDGSKSLHDCCSPETGDQCVGPCAC